MANPKSWAHLAFGGKLIVKKQRSMPTKGFHFQRKIIDSSTYNPEPFRAQTFFPEEVLD
jgi:hypothetical protein